MGVLEAILAIFTGIGNWMSTAFDQIIPIFWKAADTGDGGTLTFMGVLAVAGLAISVVFLLIAVVQRFLQFRG
jgi:hypothetical protein